MDYFKIGQRIRKFRKSHGFSQEELAERVNISTTHMSHIETGNTKLSLPVLVQLAQVLEVRTDDLLFEPGYPNRTDAMEEIIGSLDDCTPQQLRFLKDLIQTAKVSSQKYFL